MGLDWGDRACPTRKRNRKCTGHQPRWPWVLHPSPNWGQSPSKYECLLFWKVSIYFQCCPFLCPWFPRVMGFELGFSAWCDVVNVVSILQLCDCYTFSVEPGSALIIMIVSVLIEADRPDTPLVASLISKTNLTNLSHVSISGNFH